MSFAKVAIHVALSYKNPPAGHPVISVRMHVSRSPVVGLGQSILYSPLLSENNCLGLGFIAGLFIYPLLIITELTELAEVTEVTKVMSDSNEGEAELLAEKVKVLCWIMTGPQNHQTKVSKLTVRDVPPLYPGCRPDM